MKNIPGPVAAALANGFPPMIRAELFDVELVGGDLFYWSTLDKLLQWNGNDYVGQNPFLKRSSWRITNTMEVPTMDVTLLSTMDGFNGGPSIRAQITQGLLDGAELLLSYIWLDVSNNLNPLGSLEMFGGVVSTVDPAGSAVKIKVKGANNKLDLNAPRRLYQIGCNNTFCDSGCTLLRGSFTTSHTVAASPAPSRTFVAWTSPPPNPARCQLGTVKMTSGPAAGQSMNIAFADSVGATLAFPLYNTPVAGNTFTVFEGCPKTRAVCEDRVNDQNGLWFPYIPAAETAF